MFARSYSWKILQYSAPLVLLLPTSCLAILEMALFSLVPSPKFSCSFFYLDHSTLPVLPITLRGQKYVSTVVSLIFQQDCYAFLKYVISIVFFFFFCICNIHICKLFAELQLEFLSLLHVINIFKNNPYNNR